jgi:tetratricopeptide (TPR) repeat protein
MEESIAEHILAQKYDPFNPLHNAWLGALYCYDGQYQKSIRTALESFEIQNDYVVGYYGLGATYLEMGRMDGAIEVHQKLAGLVPLWSWQLGLTYSAAGRY